jgi:UDP-N-acetylglucosamine--dolichyl-phosphate N-acetylglucosaminephosphotransferase
MEKLLFLPILISFLTVIFLIPYWIKKAEQIGLLWDDLNKNSSEKVAGSGGIMVILGFIIGILVYIAIKTFYFKSMDNLVEIFALLSVVLIVAGIGLIDDLFGWQKGGLSARSRIILVAFATIPLMVINVGNPEIYLPIVGSLNLGILYALIIIPLGIIGTSTTFNFLAGHNGLEASQGILILSALSIESWITGSSWLSVVSLCMVASLLGFLYFNKYPAKVFPGDVLTYPVGALIAIMAIIGNYEFFAAFIFLPYIMETILKLRGKLKKSSFGRPKEDGSITNQYNKIYGLEHLAIKILEKIKPSKKAYEWEVVFLINGFQLVLIILAFTMLR